MRRLFQRLKAMFRGHVSDRHARKLERAVTEARLREHREGSIWKSGKGGFHYDH